MDYFYWHRQLVGEMIFARLGNHKDWDDVNQPFIAGDPVTRSYIWYLTITLRGTIQFYQQAGNGPDQYVVDMIEMLSGAVMRGWQCDEDDAVEIATMLVNLPDVNFSIS